MKTNFNFKKLIPNSLIAVFILTISPDLIAQEKPTEVNFKISIEKTDEGIKMESMEGSAWIKLSFGLGNDQQQAIDEYGMTEWHDISSRKEPHLSNFLFVLTKTEEGITLKGMEGTAWTNLSFSLAENRKQGIDQNGMITLN